MNISKTISLSIATIFLCTSPGYSKKMPKADGMKPVAVVELFTSEGCSSCPAAEAVLAGIKEQYKDRVYIVEFHVDYWNYLGWADVYSSKENTMRQQHYVQAMGLNSSYTPQAVVNGTHELVGSDQSKLKSLLSAALETPAQADLAITAAAAGREVAVRYKAANASGQLLNIAIVQKSAETNVRRGENSGRKLKHINIVRSLKTVDLSNNEGTVTLSLPKELSPADYTVIAYVQDKGSLKVNGAAMSAIN